MVVVVVVVDIVALAVAVAAAAIAVAGDWNLCCMWMSYACLPSPR